MFVEFLFREVPYDSMSLQCVNSLEERNKQSQNYETLCDITTFVNCNRGSSQRKFPSNCTPLVRRDRRIFVDRDPRVFGKDDNAIENWNLKPCNFRLSRWTKEYREVEKQLPMVDCSIGCNSIRVRGLKVGSSRKVLMSFMLTRIIWIIARMVISGNSCRRADDCFAAPKVFPRWNCSLNL